MHAIPNKVILLSQITGIFPLLFTTNSNNKRLVVYSRKLFYWGVLVLIIQLISIYAGFIVDFMYKDIGQPVRMKDNITVFSNLMDLVPLNFVAVMFVLGASTKYPHFIEMSRLLYISDTTLRNPEYTVNLWYGVLLPILHIVIQTTCSNTYESIVWFQTHENNLFALFIPGITICYMTTIAFVIQFSYVTRSITWRFKMVDEAFRRELAMTDSQGLEENNIEHNAINEGDRWPSSVDRLRTLANVYWTLCDAVVEANSFYNMQLLGVIVMLFAQLVNSSYYLFLEVWPVVDPAVIPHICIQISWVITDSAMLIAIVWPSTAVTNAVDEIGTTLCKLMTNELSQEKRRQLNIFLRQIPYNCARFSALGFFEVRNHILTSIAGSVTTYLVILIQFYTNSKE